MQVHWSLTGSSHHPFHFALIIWLGIALINHPPYVNAYVNMFKIITTQTCSPSTTLSCSKFEQNCSKSIKLVIVPPKAGLTLLREFELSVLTAAAESVSPSGDQAHGTSRCAAIGQAHSAHIVVQSGR